MYFTANKTSRTPLSFGALPLGLSNRVDSLPPLLFFLFFPGRNSHSSSTQRIPTQTTSTQSPSLSPKPTHRPLPFQMVPPSFSATLTPDSKMYARGAQDDKCIAMQYMEAIRNLKAKGFTALRTVRISFVPDEEIGGFDGSAKFVKSKKFEDLNVGFVLDEGQASSSDEFRVFYADRSPWGLIIRASGAPGHGPSMYDYGAMENLMKSVEVVTWFRESQFDVVKAGEAMNSEIISVNPLYLKAGMPSPMDL